MFEKGEISEPGLRLLVITRDDAFSSRLDRIASACVWSISRLNSADDATALLAQRTASLIIYDSGLPGDWRPVLQRLAAPPGQRCILLASPVVDEYLRREVVDNRGYDVLAKFAAPENVIRDLRFAWFWMVRSRQRE
jgi:DNA-binding response OmpR family regulator